jgi:predicted ATPase
MIKLLKLKNFKAFEDQLIKFNYLTLLSGLNSTGKSSVLQALLLLRQSYQQDLLPQIGLALNGELVSIGTAQDALFEGAGDDSIGFEISFDDSNEGVWLFNYNREADVLAIASQPMTSDIYQSSLFSDKFHYLQAERIAPRTYFEISDFQVRQHKQIGTKGEYTAHFLSIYRDTNISNSHLSHYSAKSLNLRDQVEAWLGEVSPGTRIEIKSNPDMDLVSLQYSYGLSNPYRATNVGFGITYTLPIIVAVLASEPGTLILIENPEAHLHPKGQAKMGELLALAASCGIQVVIETHSDHVLNGIRLAVHGGKLDPKDVQLHYFQRQEKNGLTFTEVVSPRIDRNGRIDQWPDGFFDEWDKSLITLLKPRDL